MNNYNIRKAKAGELDKIIDVANSAFIPVRTPDYDFRRTIPKIYNTSHDYSDIHHVAEVDGKLVAICGNLIRTIDVDGEYPFSVVGTVSTRPECQQLGFMHALMDAVDKECREKNLVFSLLTGQRRRYNFFGFEKAGFQYVFEFDDYFSKHHAVDGIMIHETTREEREFCCQLYQSTQIFNLRDANTFFDCLSDCRAKVYSIFHDEQQIGYFVTKKGQVIEFYINDYSVLASVVNVIILSLGMEKVEFVVNPLHKKLAEEFDKIAQQTRLEDNLHFKVYRMDKFVEMLLKINSHITKFSDCVEVYEIDGGLIEIKIEGGRCSVVKIKKSQTVLAKFTSAEFVRFALSPFSQTRISKIFPVVFGIDSCDMF